MMLAVCDCLTKDLRNIKFDLGYSGLLRIGFTQTEGNLVMDYDDDFFDADWAESALKAECMELIRHADDSYTVMYGDHCVIDAGDLIEVIEYIHGNL